MAHQPDLSLLLGAFLYDAIRLNHNNATLTQITNTINDDILPYGKLTEPVNQTQVREALKAWGSLYPTHHPRRYTTRHNTRSILLDVITAKQALQHTPEGLRTRELLTVIRSMHPTIPTLTPSQLIENLRHQPKFQYDTETRRISLIGQAEGDEHTRRHWWLIASLLRNPSQTLSVLHHDIIVRSNRARHETTPEYSVTASILENNPLTFAEENNKWRLTWLPSDPPYNRLTLPPRRAIKATTQQQPQAHN